MKTLDLTKYGITGAVEIVHNPTYEELFVAETDPALEGFEKGQETELGAVNVMTIQLIRIIRSEKEAKASDGEHIIEKENEKDEAKG